MSHSNYSTIGAGRAAENGVAMQRPHAPNRWEKRTPAAVPLLEAWQDGVVVDAPESCGSEIRLYPPYDALLVYRAGLLRTVKDATQEPVHAPRLTECPT